MHDSSLRASATLAYTRAAMQQPEKLCADPRRSANRKRDKRAACKKTGRKAILILALRQHSVISMAPTGVQSGNSSKNCSPPYRATKSESRRNASGNAIVTWIKHWSPD